MIASDSGASVMESLHLKQADDEKSIRYTHEAKGPRGERHVNEILFDLDEHVPVRFDSFDVPPGPLITPKCQGAEFTFSL